MAQKVVLLVEAEQPEGLSARKRILETLHYQVLVARTGDEALSTIERANPDIVLVHSNIEGHPCENIVTAISRRYPHLKMVALAPGATSLCGPVTTIDSLRPHDLVRLFNASA